MVWKDSKEVTEYDSAHREVRWWGVGEVKTWWTSDPYTTAESASTTSSGWGAVNSNSTDMTPWFVAIDTDGDIYITASEEIEGGVGVDRDVFKYDGTSGGVIGRLSNCLGGEK